MRIFFLGNTCVFALLSAPAIAQTPSEASSQAAPVQSSGTDQSTTDSAGLQDIAAPKEAAQADATSDGPTLEAQTGEDRDIVVTATKRAESLSDVPMSITALSGEQLAARGIEDIQGLAKVTPGLSFVESGNGVPVYSLRGIGFFETSMGARPTVSIYSDEAPLPFSVMSQGASFDLERVEVLKGPQGTLFGQNATGGAINYVAAKPRNHFEAGLIGSVDRFQEINLQGYATGPISQNLSVRIAARGQSGGDWQKSYTRDDELGAKRFYQGRLTLQWKPSYGTVITGTADGFIDRSDTQAGQLIAIMLNAPAQAARIPLLTSYPLWPGGPRAADWENGEELRRNNEYYHLALRIDQDVTENISLTSLSSYANMEMYQVIDLDGTAVDNARSRNTGQLSSASTELRLAGQHESMDWLVGFNYARDESFESNDRSNIYSTAYYNIPTGFFESAFLEGTQEFDTWAAFGNVDFRINESITLHAGARYTITDLDYTACSRAGTAITAATLTAFYNRIRGARGLSPLASIAVGECISTDATLTPALARGDLNEDNVSWRAGVDWKPSPRALLYANISRGYKAGSGPVLPALSNAQLVPVTQESVLAYEVGFKAGLAGGILDASGAIFYYNYSDKQLKSRVLTFPNIFGPLEALVNIPDTSVKGAELQLSAFPTQGLSLTIAGSYLRTNVDSDYSNFTITGLSTSFKGESFPYTPRWQGIIDGRYEWPLSREQNAFVQGSANYRSGTTAGFGEEAIIRIDAYTLVDAQIGIEAEDRAWRVSLFGRNITNEYYWTNVAKIVDGVRRLPGNPRTFGVQAALRFR